MQDPGQEVLRQIAVVARAALGAAPPQRPLLDLAAWHASRYSGPPPALEWLVESLIPLRAPGVLAALGGIGKSFLALELALAVARGHGAFLGRQITCGKRAAVVISFEDTAASIHRRLAAIDPTQSYTDLPLYVVSVPDLGHGWTLASQTASGIDDSGAAALLEQLAQIQRAIGLPIGLVVIDPLQAAVSGDLTSAPEVAQAVCTILARIAAQAGAAVVATHHVRKGSPVGTVQEARDAIRGTTALVDGVRFAIALWPAPEEVAATVADRLGTGPRGWLDVVQAALVKSNEPGDQTIHTLRRDARGLLVDVTAAITDPTELPEPELARLVDAIAQAAACGRPFKRRVRSEAGLGGRHEELPEPLRHWSERRLERAVSALLEDGRIVAALAGSGGVSRWLDVPDGPFARGVGEFAPGAATPGDGDAD